MTQLPEEPPFGEVSMHSAQLTVSSDAGSFASFELHVRGPHRVVAAVLHGAAEAFLEEAER